MSRIVLAQGRGGGVLRRALVADGHAVREVGAVTSLGTATAFRRVARRADAVLVDATGGTAGALAATLLLTALDRPRVVTLVDADVSAPVLAALVRRADLVVADDEPTAARVRALRGRRVVTGADPVGDDLAGWLTDPLG